MTKPIGLSNGSNYCYYITTIQLLMAVPGVQAEIAKLFKQQEQLRNDISKDLYHLTQKLPNYKLLSGYTTFFNTYHPPVQEMPKTETEASAEADQEQLLKESLNKESIKESKKEKSSSSESEPKKPLTWFEYITWPFYKLKQFTIYVFGGIKAFFNDYILEPVSAFIEYLFKEGKEDAAASKKRYASQHGLSAEDVRSAETILSNMEKYYLIQLITSASQEYSPVENLSFEQIWNRLKQIIKDQNTLKGRRGVAQEDLQLMSLIEKLELQQVFGMTAVESSMIKPALEVPTDHASFFAEKKFTRAPYPSLMLSQFEEQDLDILKQILLESEDISELKTQLFKKIDESTPELLKNEIVFNQEERVFLNNILTEHQDLLHKLTPYKARKRDLITGIMLAPASDLSEPTKAILPTKLFEFSENEIIDDYQPEGKEASLTISRELSTNYEVLDETSALNFKIKLGFKEGVNSYKINPPLTVTARVAGSDNEKTYYLHAIAMKHGGQGGGHWTSYRACLNDQGSLAWHHLNDSSVTLVKKFSVESGYPSELIYIELPEEGDLRSAYGKSSLTPFDFRGETGWFQRLNVSHKKSVEMKDAEKKKSEKKLISVGTQTDDVSPKRKKGCLIFTTKPAAIFGRTGQKRLKSDQSGRGADVGLKKRKHKIKVKK